MSRLRFFRQQAEVCFRLAQQCSDELTADQLRLLGAEFFRRATEAENDWLNAKQPSAARPAVPDARP
jgi:hypothetical protein